MDHPRISEFAPPPPLATSDKSDAVIGRRVIAKYSSAQTNPMAAAVISAGTKDPLACTMNPVTVGASAPPRYPPKFCIAPSDAVVFAGAATEAIAQADELAT